MAISIRYKKWSKDRKSLRHKGDIAGRSDDFEIKKSLDNISIKLHTGKIAMMKDKRICSHKLRLHHTHSRSLIELYV